MRVVKCHECNTPTTQAAEVCPQCRSPIPRASADAASAQVPTPCGPGLVCAIAQTVLCGVGALAFIVGGLGRTPWLILMGAAYMLLGLPGMMGTILHAVCPSRSA